MLWIIIGLGILIAIGWTIFSIYGELDFITWLAGIGVLILIFTFLSALYASTIDLIGCEYEDGQKAEEYELISLREDTTSVGGGNWRYISIYAENSYTYYLEAELTESYGEGTPYKSYTISGENVFIVEDDKYINNAKLIKYIRTPKNRFWNSGILKEKVEYVFYVPTGSIVQQIGN